MNPTLSVIRAVSQSLPDILKDAENGLTSLARELFTNFMKNYRR